MKAYLFNQNSKIVWCWLLCCWTLIMLSGCNGGGSNTTTPVNPNSNPLTISLDSGSGGISAGENNVSLMPLIVLKFSQPMDISSINAQTITLTSDGNNQANTLNSVQLGAFTANSNGSEFSVQPQNNLNPNLSYRLTISDLVVSSTGIRPESAISFTFTTGNVAAPTVAILSPTNDESDVSLNPLIQLKFSESVSNVTTNTISLLDSSESSLVAIESITVGANNSYSLMLAESLLQLHNYTVRVGSGVANQFGINLVAQSFSFTTGKFSHPQALLLSPSNGSTNVGLSPIITLQFSEAVQNVSLATLELHESSCSGQAVQMSAITQESANIYQFSSQNALNLGQTYCLTLSPQISDEYGNSVVESNFYFVTQSAIWQNTNGNVQVSGGIFNSSIVYNPQTKQPYLAVIDRNHEASVFRYQDSQWLTVGAAGVGGESADDVSLAINPQGGQLYLTYQSRASSTFRVMEFNGSSWQQLGDQSIFSSLVSDSDSGIPFAISKTGIPYLAFIESTLGMKTTVLGYINSQWQVIGSRGFSDGWPPIVGIALNINQNNQPEIAYQSYDSGNAVMMEFDGVAWNYLGNSIPLTNDFGPMRMIINPLNNSPVIMTYGRSNYGVSLYTLVGNTWQQLGSNSELPSNVATYSNLVYNQAGTLFFAYTTFSNNIPSVMEYTGGHWQTLPATLTTPLSGINTYLAINPITDLPTIAYQEGSWDFSQELISNYISVK